MANRVGALGGTPFSREHPTFQDVNDSFDAVVAHTNSEIQGVQGDIQNALDSIKTPKIIIISGTKTYQASKQVSGNDYDIDDTDVYSISSSILAPLKDAFNFVAIGAVEIENFLDRGNVNDPGLIKMRTQFRIRIDGATQGFRYVESTRSFITDEFQTPIQAHNFYIPLEINQSQLDNGFNFVIETSYFLSNGQRAQIAINDIIVKNISIIGIPKYENINI